MEPNEINKLENHELLNLMDRMSPSGAMQVLRTILIPEAGQFLDAVSSRPIGDEADEWMLSGIEAKNEAALSSAGLLNLFTRTQNFDGYAEARESCKKALAKLSSMKHWRKVANLPPRTVEFDVEFFFAEFMPWKYETALVEHQGTIADAAGRGDLAFFRRQYDRVKNNPDLKGAGFYNHMLVTYWLHGFFWLMPDKLACGVVVQRMTSLLDAAGAEGIGTQDKKMRKKLTCSSGATHEAQRKRFREAVKYLGLYQHPERPVIQIRELTRGEPNSACYVWKQGWPT